MQIDIPTLDGWVATSDGERVYQSDTRPGISIHVSKLIPRPPLVSPNWILARLRRELVSDESIRPVPSELAPKSTWPMRWFWIECGDETGHRLVASCQFLYFNGVIEVRSHQRIEPGDPLLTAIAAATPNLSGEIACLGDLFDLAAPSA